MSTAQHELKFGDHGRTGPVGYETINDFDSYPIAPTTRASQDVIQMMRRGMNISIEKGVTINSPGAFRITYQSLDPTIFAKVVNRIANLYIEENLRAREVRVEVPPILSIPNGKGT